MDPLESIHSENDTTVHLLDAAQRHGFLIFYLPQNKLSAMNGKVFGTAEQLEIHLNNSVWFKKTHTQENLALTEFDVILMRKDPPFTLEYIYTTYLLELAEKAGVFVLNKPQSLRDANEKVFATYFPQCMPPTLITSDSSKLYRFWETYKSTVFKPLDGMAGQSIFVAHENDPNVHVIIETLTKKSNVPILAQKYLPEIHTTGDKRILLINGNPVPFALARFPSQGETRANLAVGGKGIVVPLTERDYWLCQQISHVLKEKELLFVGIDVIGEYITEINVTSPTGLPIIARTQSLDIAGQLIDVIKEKLNKNESSYKQI